MGKGKNINVDINANILVPNTDRLPIYEISLDKVSQQQVDGFLSMFDGVEYHHGMKFYDKAYYEKRILELKEYISITLPTKDVDEETRKSLKEEYERGIKNLTRKMNRAPETIQSKVKPIFTNEYYIKLCEQDCSAEDPEEAKKDNQIMRESCEKDNTELVDVAWEYNDKDMRFAVCRSDSPIFNSLIFEVLRRPTDKPILHFDNTVKNTKDISVLKTTYSEAKEIAEDIIVNKLGIKYYSLAHSARQGEEFYVFYFTRNINGVNDTYCSNDQTYNERYEEPWKYEKLSILIGGEGLHSISMGSSLTKLGKKISEDVNLLPFEKVMQIAKERFMIGDLEFGTYFDSELYENIVNMDLKVDEIEFGYMRVKLSNKNEYAMVPVWDFFGDYSVKSKFDDGSNYEKNSKDMDYVHTYRNSFLTINAIDGSIINRELGY
jgi:hypothetical protein